MYRHVDLGWHWRAYRARQRWQLTRQAIARWLALPEALPSSLILLGGSAGWMMSGEFLARFERVLLIDLDPLAPWLMRWNHRPTLRSTRLQFRHWVGDAHQLLPRALAEDRQACVLFDNFLGLDSMYTGNLEVTAERLRRVHEQVSGRWWGSVHDRLSGPGTSQWQLAPCWARPWTLNAGQALPQQQMLQAVQAQGEWIDHGTEAVLPSPVATTLIPWPIVPGRWHWLQAGWVPPG